MEPNEEMRLKIKKLIYLLKKIRERDIDLNFMSEEDKSMIQGLDFIIKNFENFDIQFDTNLNNFLPPQLKTMIDPLIKMLSEELAEDIDINITNELDDITPTKKDEQTLLKVVLKAPTTDEILSCIDENVPIKHRLMMAIQQIDEMLKSAEAGSKLADDLLDTRIELLNQLKVIS